VTGCEPSELANATPRSNNEKIVSQPTVTIEQIVADLVDARTLDRNDR
jgi:hypothetical protein